MPHLKPVCDVIVKLANVAKAIVEDIHGLGGCNGILHNSQREGGQSAEAKEVHTRMAGYSFRASSILRER